jgi:hypothetical protein
MSKLLDSAIAVATGGSLRVDQVNRTFQVTVAGTGSVSATVVIEGSNDGTNFLALAAVTLSGTNSASDGFVSQAKWTYVRAKLTAISGTGAAVTVTMGA